MKRAIAMALVVCFAVGLVLVGCGPQKAETSQEAINTAKTMDTVQEQTKYLVAQAKDFYNSKEFQGAVDIAQYILRYLDKDSPEARDLLKKAQEALTAQIREQAEEAKKSIPGFGK